jgi:hypothetical protein
MSFPISKILLNMNYNSLNPDAQIVRL